MTQKIDQYKVFIASPSDLNEERKLVHKVCETLNNSPLVKDRNIRLDPVGWEDVPPSAGRPQDTINRLQKDCDIFICILHKNYGTPTGSSGSGTEEEFLNAYESWKHLKKPKILFYFRTFVASPEDFDNLQIQKVMGLRKKIQKNEMLIYGLFNSVDNFVEQLQYHLEAVIPDLGKLVEIEEKEKLENRESVIPKAYINWLKDKTGYMDLEELSRDSNVINVRLPEIYLPLFSDDPDVKPDDKDKMRNRKPLAIEEIAGKGESLLVIGTSGTGKTTLAKYMAIQVVQEKSPYFEKGTLPVFICFKDMKRLDIRGKTPNTKLAREILSWYADEFTGGMLDLETVLAFCSKGQFLLILDGLDESDREFRDLVVSAFADFRHNCQGMQTVLLGRPHGVEGEASNRFGHRKVMVHDLTDEQANKFICKWFTNVYTEGINTGKALADKMIGEISTRENMDDLKKNPLMLTAMCILYNESKALPDQRADLYNRFIERLLGKFGAERNLVRQFVMKLAHDMFEQGERGMDRCDALKLLGVFMPPEDTDTCMETEFDRIEPATGLLGLESGQYKFLHLAFQEFLTARFLYDDLEGDPYKKIAPFVTEPRYEEVVRLFIGFLSLSSAGSANAIVRKIFEQEQAGKDAGNWIIAGKSFLDMHESARKHEVSELAQDRMLTVIQKGSQPKVLLEAGETLGRLGYRKGYKDFVDIEGGAYELEELGKKKIEAFQISRFPVVNFWFKEFMEDGGYKDRELWTEHGWKWLKETKISEPMFFREKRLNCPNSPVVGISWYEAKTFCNWLTRKEKGGFTYDLPTEAQWQAAAAGKKGRKYPWGKRLSPDHCNYNKTYLQKPSPVGIFEKGKTSEEVYDLAGNVWDWTRTAHYQNETISDIPFNKKAHRILIEKENTNRGDYISLLRDTNRVIPVLRGGSFYFNAEHCHCAVRYNYKSFYPGERNFDIGLRCIRMKL